MRLPRSEGPLQSLRTWFPPARSCIKSATFAYQDIQAWGQTLLCIFCSRSAIFTIHSCPGKTYYFESITTGLYYFVGFRQHVYYWNVRLRELQWIHSMACLLISLHHFCTPFSCGYHLSCSSTLSLCHLLLSTITCSL